LDIVTSPSLRWSCSTVEAAFEEGITPPRQRGASHAEFTGERVEILASEEAEDGITLAFGREPAAIGDGRMGGSGCCLSVVQRDSGAALV
jgi:hypothetical protein